MPHKLSPQSALADLKEKKPESVTIVCLSGDMDKAMAAFIIATGAAAMGMKVTMFFHLLGVKYYSQTRIDQLRQGLDAPGLWMD